MARHRSLSKGMPPLISTSYFFVFGLASSLFMCRSSLITHIREVSKFGWVLRIAIGSTYFIRRWSSARFSCFKTLSDNYLSIFRNSMPLLNGKTGPILNRLLGNTRNNASSKLTDKLNMSCTNSSNSVLLGENSLSI